MNVPASRPAYAAYAKSARFFADHWSSRSTSGSWDALLTGRIGRVAYGTAADPVGKLPQLAPMSRIAGSLAALIAFDAAEAAADSRMREAVWSLAPTELKRLLVASYRHHIAAWAGRAHRLSCVA